MTRFTRRVAIEVAAHLDRQQRISCPTRSRKAVPDLAAPNGITARLTKLIISLKRRVLSSIRKHPSP